MTDIKALMAETQAPNPLAFDAEDYSGYVLLPRFTISPYEFLTRLMLKQLLELEWRLPSENDQLCNADGSLLPTCVAPLPGRGAEGSEDLTNLESLLQQRFNIYPFATHHLSDPDTPSPEEKRCYYLQLRVEDLAALAKAAHENDIHFSAFHGNGGRAA